MATPDERTTKEQEGGEEGGGTGMRGAWGNGAGHATQGMRPGCETANKECSIPGDRVRFKAAAPPP